MCAPLRAVPARPSALDAAAPIARPIPSLTANRDALASRVGGMGRAHVRRALPLPVGGAHAAGLGVRRAAGAAVSDPVGRAARRAHVADAAYGRPAARALAVVGAAHRRQQGACRARRGARAGVREAQRSGVCGRLL